MKRDYCSNQWETVSPALIQRLFLRVWVPHGSDLTTVSPLSWGILYSEEGIPALMRSPGNSTSYKVVMCNHDPGQLSVELSQNYHYT